MKLIYTKGATSKRIQVFVRDSSQTDGRGLTGLVFNTGSLTAYYSRPGSTPAAITLATQTVTGAYSSGGFVAVDGTNMPGVYRFDIPDACLATGADNCVIMLRGATNMEPVLIEIQLVDVNLEDAVRMGLTALPNVASGNAGALITAGTGTAQLSVTSGRANADVTAISTDTTAADNLEAMFDGSGYNASASNVGATIADGHLTAAKFGNNFLTAAGVASDASAEIATAVGALICEDDPNRTLAQILSLLLAYACGETEDGGTTFLSPAGNETRITGSVNGSNERSGITTTPAVI